MFKLFLSTKQARVVNGVSMHTYNCLAMKEGVRNQTLVLMKNFKSHIESWDASPVFVNHPKINGEYAPVTYNPQLLTQSLGYMSGARIAGDSFHCNINIFASNSLYINEVLPVLKRDGNIGVSLGILSDIIYKDGWFNQERYNSIPVNIVSDHIAILPNELGACSLKDGCSMYSHNNTANRQAPLVLPQSYAGALPQQHTIYTAPQTQQGGTYHAPAVAPVYTAPQAPPQAVYGPPSPAYTQAPQTQQGGTYHAPAATPVYTAPQAPPQAVYGPPNPAYAQVQQERQGGVYRAPAGNHLQAPVRVPNHQPVQHYPQSHPYPQQHVAPHPNAQVYNTPNPSQGQVNQLREVLPFLSLEQISSIRPDVLEKLSDRFLPRQQQTYVQGQHAVYSVSNNGPISPYTFDYTAALGAYTQEAPAANVQQG